MPKAKKQQQQVSSISETIPENLIRERRLNVDQYVTKHPISGTLGLFIREKFKTFALTEGQWADRIATLKDKTVR
ncbi:hypothetical protein FACS1894172_15180 [Spirochaetia bacterium]|nr:hypothetical protein FACS1894164_04130 [Spirochaetia bacterium]GHU34635.1 hypothetical protein FACS1894172_15180 [Spirochaetia bacterium]